MKKILGTLIAVCTLFVFAGCDTPVSPNPLRIVPTQNRTQEAVRVRETLQLTIPTPMIQVIRGILAVIQPQYRHQVFCLLENGIVPMDF